MGINDSSGDEEDNPGAQLSSAKAEERRKPQIRSSRTKSSHSLRFYASRVKMPPG